MSVRVVGTSPVQVALPNPRRHIISVQLLPNNIVAGNTGLVFGKFGSAPTASLNSNSWDFVLNAGAQDGSNLYETRDQSVHKGDLWLISDTADQQVNMVDVEFPVDRNADTSDVVPV